MKRDAPGRILFILLHNPGDVVMGLHAVAEARRLFPGSELDFMVGEGCRSLVESHPHISNVWVLPDDSCRKAWKEKREQDCLTQLDAFLEKIGRRHWGLAFNLFQDISGAPLYSLLRVDSRYGLFVHENGQVQLRGRALRHLAAIPANRAQNGLHVVDIYRMTVREAYMDWHGEAPKQTDRPNPCLPYYSQESLSLSAQNQEYLATNAERFYALQPGSAWVGKRWPVDSWARLAEILCQAGHPVVLLGSPEEKALAECVLSRIRDHGEAGPLNLVGQTTLLGTVPWLRAARLLITGDTAAMHIAAMAQTPCLALFGASNPVETGPYGPGHLVWQLSAELPSTLPLNLPCPSLEDLAPEEVAHLALLGRQPARGLLWETSSSVGGHQLLVSPTGELHPSQQNPVWPKISVTVPASGETGSSSVEELLVLLDRAIQQPEVRELKELEAREQRFAMETDADIIWEAYRIHINGLSLNPLRDYLENRRLSLLKSAGEKKG